MGRREVEMIKIGSGGTLVAAFSAALLALILLAVPADAQDDSRAETDLAGETARITESDSDPDEIVDRIVVAAGDCRVDADASVVVEDNDGTQVTLNNGQNVNQNVNITATTNGVTIVGRGDGGNLNGIAPSGGTDPQFGTEGQTVDGQIVSSTGIRCEDNTGDDNGNDGGNGNGSGTDDNAEDLSCDKLLVLFRGDEQYEDGGTAVDLNDSDVRAQIEVCLKKEIVNNPGGNLPKTGGVSVLAVAVLGLVSAAAGLSVIRGGRRQG